MALSWNYGRRTGWRFAWTGLILSLVENPGQCFTFQKGRNAWLEGRRNSWHSDDVGKNSLPGNLHHRGPRSAGSVRMFDTSPCALLTTDGRLAPLTCQPPSPFTASSTFFPFNLCTHRVAASPRFRVARVALPSGLTVMSVLMERPRDELREFGGREAELPPLVLQAVHHVGHGELVPLLEVHPGDPTGPGVVEGQDGQAEDEAEGPPLPVLGAELLRIPVEVLDLAQVHLDPDEGLVPNL